MRTRCGPSHPGFAPIVLQAPIFISFFFAIQKMSESIPSFKEGGAAWFMDLSAADPTFALPVISSLTFLLAIEFSPPTAGGDPATKMYTKYGMRALAVAMVPMTWTFSSGIFVYWVTTNSFSFVQMQAGPDIRFIQLRPTRYHLEIRSTRPLDFGRFWAISDESDRFGVILPIRRSLFWV